MQMAAFGCLKILVLAIMITSATTTTIATLNTRLKATMCKNTSLLAAVITIITTVTTITRAAALKQKYIKAKASHSRVPVYNICTYGSFKYSKDKF